ncbi:MAG: hypothetical protein ACFBSE_21610 [Prochloraceae cyanobacterium]
MNQNLLETLKKICPEQIGELINSCRISIESYQLEENNSQESTLFAMIYSPYCLLNELLVYETELDLVAEEMGLNSILIIPEGPNNLDYFFKTA